MRLHRLRVQALQAFAETHEVDFDALSDAGLFLLHGDTGAGKTTLLDAVCFALFGKLPGPRGLEARLRSDHAVAALATEVVLEATLRGERVRITRAPRQERPKVRGGGLTSEGEKVLVEARDAGGGWRVLATRLDEAREEIDRLVGMSATQFAQVVLLPQGEFATFLRATSDERWTVLEKLFSAERFVHAEDWLTGRRQAAEEQGRVAGASIADVASRLAEAMDDEPPEGWEAEPARLSGWVGAAVLVAEAEAVTAGEACAQATAARDAAEAAAVAARGLQERRERHATAVGELAAFEATRATRDDAEAQLRGARAAAAVRPVLDDLAVRAARAERAARAAQAAVAATRLPGAPRGLADPDLLRERAGALRTTAGEVGTLASVESGVVRRREELRAEREREAEASDALAAAEEGLAAGGRRRPALLAAARAAQRCADVLDDRVAAARQARERADAATRRDALAVRLTALDDELAAATAAQLTAQSAWLDLREARLDGMAAELAGELKRGRPCSVCGAKEHPEPARPTLLSVDAEVEERARTRHEERSGERVAAQTAVEAARADRAGALALAGDAPAEDLLRTAERAEGEAERARAGAAAGPAAAAALAAQEDEAQRHEAERVRAGAQIATARARAEQWQATLQEDERTLAAGLGGAVSVRERVDALVADAVRCETAAQAVRAASDAETDRAATEAGAAAAAREAGFAEVAAARAALRSPEVVERLQDQLSAYDEGLAERRAIAADPALLEAVARPAPDLDAVAAAARGAAEAQAAAEGALALTRRTEHALRRLERDLARRLEALAPVAAEIARVRDLAYLVDGSSSQNAKRMRLSAYVLAARLEEIAAAASVRLEAMSAGRYALAHSDERASRGKRGGLDLRVVDGWTGRDRHPSTLSGGETFLASLALALGLADVVAAETGGARLETLFVDEGFGSLDEATLDEVLEVLDGLRDGGRAVGIVSHVGELRQRVGAQLHVVKGRHGSEVRQAATA